MKRLDSITDVITVLSQEDTDAMFGKYKIYKTYNDTDITCIIEMYGVEIRTCEIGELRVVLLELSLDDANNKITEMCGDIASLMSEIKKLKLMLQKQVAKNDTTSTIN